MNPVHHTHWVCLKAQVTSTTFVGYVALQGLPCTYMYVYKSFGEYCQRILSEIGDIHHPWPVAECNYTIPTLLWFQNLTLADTDSWYLALVAQSQPSCSMVIPSGEEIVQTDQESIVLVFGAGSDGFLW